jgi:hypothetical protein
VPKNRAIVLRMPVAKDAVAGVEAVAQ